MSESVQEALSALRGPGGVDEMKALAADGLAPKVRPRINSHIHFPPNFSAFQSVEQAVSLAADQGIGVLGAGNYYDYEVYGQFVAQARRRGVFPLFGLEIIALIDELVRKGVLINDPGNPGKIYICGKGITRFDEMTPKARELLGIIRRNDSQRMAEMVARLAEIFASHGLDTGVDTDAVIDMIVRRHGCERRTVYLQERHAAMAFQQAFFRLVPPEQRLGKLAELFGTASKATPDDEVTIQNEIRSHLMKAGKPAFVAETFVSFEQAYRLILELGGIPCYPTLADGTRPICEYEDPVEKLIGRIQANHIHCVEFIPIRNTPAVLSRYVRAMREAGLIVVAGTEHNTLDLLPIEPACVRGEPIPEPIKEIIWEGTCVVAAHQFLNFRGRCGYVDAEGNLNPAYESQEERIEQLAALGAAVIEKYRDRFTAEGAENAES